MIRRDALAAGFGPPSSSRIPDPACCRSVRHSERVPLRHPLLLDRVLGVVHWLRRPGIPRSRIPMSSPRCGTLAVSGTQPSKSVGCSGFRSPARCSSPRSPIPFSRIATRLFTSCLAATSCWPRGAPMAHFSTLCSGTVSGLLEAASRSSAAAPFSVSITTVVIRRLPLMFRPVWRVSGRSRSSGFHRPLPPIRPTRSAAPRVRFRSLRDPSPEFDCLVLFRVFCCVPDPVLCSLLRPFGTAFPAAVSRYVPAAFRHGVCRR